MTRHKSILIAAALILWVWGGFACAQEAAN